jgi:hypothetical protein
MYNLLQKRHDLITEKFINDIISYKDYENYELHYNRIKHLFTICLN